MSYYYRSALSYITKKINMDAALRKQIYGVDRKVLAPSVRLYFRASFVLSCAVNCTSSISANLSMGELDVCLATRLDVGVVPPDAHNKRDHHRQEVVDVNGPFVR